MLHDALKDALKVIITFGFIFAAAGVALPFALFGLLAMATLDARGIGAGLLLLATAAVIWAAFGAWLAWCSGRLPQRFSMRAVLIGMTIATVYLGLIATYMSQMR